MAAEQATDQPLGNSRRAPLRVAVVVVAGGRGTRASTGAGDAPKQYRQIGGRAVIAETIARLAATAPADSPAPAPLYIRPADAAPARDLPPVILDDA